MNKLYPVPGCTCEHKNGVFCRNGIGHSPDCFLYPELYNKFSGRNQVAVAIEKEPELLKTCRMHFVEF